MELFSHVRIIIGVVMSLGLTHLLQGIASLVQHPEPRKVYMVHLLWVVSMVLYLLHFWWWEFRLRHLADWTFLIYVFLIVYTVLLYLLCSLLFPRKLAPYADFEEYFLSRRRWFFGLMALVYLLDIIDTALKGDQHLQSLGLEYLVRIAVYVVLCLVAMQTTSHRFHLVFVIASLAYQISFALRLFWRETN